MNRKEYKFGTLSPTKVTLKDWVRLTNAPLLLPRPSAVQWNEYVFLLVKDGTALLYHTKHGMWSVLPRCDKQLPSGPPPLTLHNGQVLTMSTGGEILSYNHQYSQWETLQYNTLRLIGNNHIRVAALTSYGDALLSTVEPSNHPLLSGNRLHCEVHIYQSNKWEKICDIATTAQSLCSTTLLGSDLYIQAGERVHKLTLPKHKGHPGMKDTPLVGPLAPPKLGGPLSYSIQMPARPVKEEPLMADPQQQPTGIKSPPYTDSTLHVVKDTLFAFGGRDKDNQPTSDVLRYNPDTDSWESAGYMRSARYNVAVATGWQDSTYNVHVIGGSLGSSNLEMKSKITMSMPFNTPRTTSGSLFGGPLKLGGLQYASQQSWECNSCITERCSMLQQY